MVEIARIPDRLALKHDGGKDVDHVAWYEKTLGRVRAKRVMDVVADDGTVYRWTRFSADERWTFDQRVAPESDPDPVRRQLPGRVEQLVSVSDDVYYK